MIMHDIEMLAAWFLLIKAGMILTMLLPRITPESRGREVNHDACERIPAHQGLHEQAGSMILIEKEA
jgi:hypothetical protein